MTEPLEAAGLARPGRAGLRTGESEETDDRAGRSDRARPAGWGGERMTGGRGVPALLAVALLLPVTGEAAQAPAAPPPAAEPAAPPAQASAEPPPAAEPAAPPVETAAPGATPAPVADGRPPAALFTAATAAAAAGESEAALGLFEGALTQAPDNLFYGAEYRQAVIAAGAYDRALEFFKGLAAAHPRAANLMLNYGYAYVDKIPAAGAVTQVILANTALRWFSKALEVDDSWLGRYTRGNSYVYWPPIFGRLPQGIADLEQAVARARELPERSYQALAWAALGDGYWRSGDPGKARETWREGLARFPGDPRLERRAGVGDAEVEAFYETHYDPGTRVDTSLRELWQAGWQEACDCDPATGSGGP
jgi:tetratricopeptide (TPR) repeat protein